VTAADHPGAERAAAWLRGEEKARGLMLALRCCLGDGDELLRVLQSITDPDELCGCARSIQKELERADRR
jgi:hypothetical protein